jgi:hypothetical protein
MNNTVGLMLAIERAPCGRLRGALDASNARTEVLSDFLWHCTLDLKDAGRRAEVVMFFSLPGFQNWQFRYVLHGGTMRLEAVQNDLHLSAVLTPLESISRQADQLIRCYGEQSLSSQQVSDADSLQS